MFEARGGRLAVLGVSIILGGIAWAMGSSAAAYESRELASVYAYIGMWAGVAGVALVLVGMMRPHGGA